MDLLIIIKNMRVFYICFIAVVETTLKEMYSVFLDF